MFLSVFLFLFTYQHIEGIKTGNDERVSDDVVCENITNMILHNHNGDASKALHKFVTERDYTHDLPCAHFIQVFKSLVEASADLSSHKIITARDIDQRPALLQIVHSISKENPPSMDIGVRLMEQLMDAGHDINLLEKKEKDIWGTILSNLLWQGAYYNDIVRMIVERGADVNLCSRSDTHPFCYAAEHNNISIAEYLITKGVNLKAAVLSSRTGWCSLKAVTFLCDFVKREINEHKRWLHMYFTSGLILSNKFPNAALMPLLILRYRSAVRDWVSVINQTWNEILKRHEAHTLRTWMNAEGVIAAYQDFETELKSLVDEIPASTSKFLVF